MTTTETPFLHQVRLARCQALAKELAELRARLPFARGVDVQPHKVACAALEADLLQAAGTPEQRALEAAQEQLEGPLAGALIALSTSSTARGVALHAERLEAVEFLRTKLRELRLPGQSDYTSEDEDTLARLRSLAASLHTDPELKNLSGTQVLAKIMEVLSPGAL